jgi:acetyl esterase/lipase
MASTIPCPSMDQMFTSIMDYAPPTEIDLEAVRKAGTLSNENTVLSKHPRLSHKEYSISTASYDSTVILSVFQSKNSTNNKRPALYHIHGGGQISGNRFMHLDKVIAYFDDIDAVFISVEYRLAPEHRAPAALDDCYAGLSWTAKHAEKLGIDASEILLYGFSGGGPLVAASAILARDRNYPYLRGQMLSGPMLDDRMNTVSAKQFQKQPCGIINRMGWDLVLGEERGGPKVTELMSPSRATDLSELPPAYIDAGERESFRDEAVAYASQIWKCGGSAEIHVWPGVGHAFEIQQPNALASTCAEAAKKAWIRRVLGINENS